MRQPSVKVKRREGEAMKRRIRWLTITVAVTAAAAGLVYWFTRPPSARDLAVERCMSGGDGDMFTWPELCEERYADDGTVR